VEKALRYRRVLFQLSWDTRSICRDALGPQLLVRERGDGGDENNNNNDFGAESHERVASWPPPTWIWTLERNEVMRASPPPL